MLPSGSTPLGRLDNLELTVLIVEDDAMVRDWIQLSLERSEFRVVGVAHTAGEVPGLIERRRPSLLLLDYRLPDGMGTELLRDLRQSGIATPALLMTANEQPGFNEAARDAGAQGTALKSGRVEELLETRPQGVGIIDRPGERSIHHDVRPQPGPIIVAVAAGGREQGEGQKRGSTRAHALRTPHRPKKENH